MFEIVPKSLILVIWKFQNKETIFGIVCAMKFRLIPLIVMHSKK